MLTRCAFFEGRVRAGQEAAFDQYIDQYLMPLWRRFPGAAAVRLQRKVAADPAAPPVHMTLEFDCPSEAVMDGAVASPVRAEAKAKTDELLSSMFDGRLYHIVFERAG
jgi:hypothetical protein